jgi:hypothetical protein
VTAKGTAPYEFARETLLALAVCPDEDVEQWYEFYKLGSLEAHARGTV